jgi:predicted phosphohydrolase
MKIVCISDTHNYHDQIDVPDGDILIHAGDATIQGTVREISAFADWFKALPHKHKIFVAGNHDWLFERKSYSAKEILGESIIYLRDSAARVENLKIYGSPWQPEFCNWAFNLPRGQQIAAMWDLIPDDVDILVTHGPPYGARDENPSGLLVGCRDLMKKVRKVKPKLHIFGHIHGGYGQIELFGTHFINASICDEAYRTTHKPIVVEI